MSGHNSGITIIDVTFERIQFNAVQACPVMMDGRQCIMRIIRSIAMPREMFSYRDDAGSFQSASIGYSFIGNGTGILSERTEADYRIIGITIYIYIGGKVDLNAHLFALAGYFLSVFGNQFIIFDSSQHHVFREACRSAKAHRQAPFSVQRNEHRDT